MIRSANPALDKEVFSAIKGYGESGMSIQGTANKTVLLLFILLSSAFIAGPQLSLDSRLTFFSVLVVTVALAVATMIYRHHAWLLGPIFAVVQGAFLGSLTIGIDTRYPGIAYQAVGLTISILASLLFLYKAQVVKASENMKLFVGSATLGIGVMYCVQLMLQTFGIETQLLHQLGWAGIAFSVFTVTMASLNLVMDFDYIEEGERNQCAKSMEWYAAFGLLVTLVWLYLELLHLLSKTKE